MPDETKEMPGKEIKIPTPEGAEKISLHHPEKPKIPLGLLPGQRELLAGYFRLEDRPEWEKKIKETIKEFRGTPKEGLLGAPEARKAFLGAVGGYTSELRRAKTAEERLEAGHNFADRIAEIRDSLPEAGKEKIDQLVGSPQEEGTLLWERKIRLQEAEQTPTRPQRRERREPERPFKELEEELGAAKERVAKESDNEAAKEKLSELEKEMNERTGGMYSLTQDLQEDLEAGKSIDEELRDAKKQISELRKKNQRDGARYIREKIDGLEKEAAKKREETRRLRPEELTLPEVPEAKGREMATAQKNLPKVYLSQLFTTLKDVELPSKEWEDFVTEEGARVAGMVYPVRTLEQAVKAGLTELHNYIKENRASFDTIQKHIVRYYIGIVKEMVGENNPIYQDFSNLTEGVIKLSEVIYRHWNIQKGEKHGGVKQLIQAMGEVDSKMILNLRRDPEIESATHRIKGNVSDEWFLTSSPDRGELGDIIGNEYGSVEKLGWYIACIEYLRGFDGQDETTAISQNIAYIRYALDYFKGKGFYERWPRLFEPICYYRVADRDGNLVEIARPEIKPTQEEIEAIGEGGFVYREHYGIKPYPSALHAPNAQTEFIFDNFTEEKLGWKNIARMLSFYGERDPRFRHEDFHYYTFTDWLFANPEQQRNMYNLVFAEFQTLEREEKRRIIRENLLQITETARVVRDKDTGRLKRDDWEVKPLLDFDEKDENGHYIVDVGSLDNTNFGKGFKGSGNYLSNFYTYEDYAWRVFDVWDKLLQINLPRDMELFKNLLEILTANEGYRHLYEDVDEHGRPVGMLSERNKQINHLFLTFSENWRAWSWIDRREGRRNPGGEVLAWETNVNQRVRMGMDMDHFHDEFDDIGLPGVGYENTYEYEIAGKYGYQEKIAKLFHKFELKDAWIAWLRDISLHEEIVRTKDVPYKETPLGEMVLTKSSYSRLIEIANEIQVAENKTLWADLEEQESNHRVWKIYPKEGIIGNVKGIGHGQEKSLNQASETEKAKIILDELTYRAIVSFAGFKVKREFLEYNQYGNPVWRTWFDYDFDTQTGRGRGDGETRKRIFKDNQWRSIMEFLIAREKEIGVGKVVPGALNNDIYSPLMYMSEKMQEDAVLASIGEAYFRASFDRDIDNYVWPHRWRENTRLDKKRWDMFASVMRNRRYTTGKLQGRYVISQLEIEYDPDTELPLFDNVKTGEKIRAWRDDQDRLMITHPATSQPVVIEEDEIYVKEDDRTYRIPKNTDPDHWLVRLKHTALRRGELRTPDVVWFKGPLSGYDQIDTMVWGLEGVWATRDDNPKKNRLNKGMGVAGLEKLLTWEPLYYKKEIRLAFFLARYCDPRYVIELGLNIGKEWELGQLYHLTADEIQRAGLYQELLNIGEDAGWISIEKARADVRDEMVVEYGEAKKQKRIPDVRGEVPAGAPEEELISLSGLVKTVTPLPRGILDRIPVIRSGVERNCVLRALAIGEVPTLGVGIAGITMGLDPLTSLLILGAGQLVPFFLAQKFIDKGVDKEGREKARGLALILGHLGAPRWLPRPLRWQPLGLGMVGDRVNARTPYTLACGYEPVHDSALPLDQLVEYWFKIPREKLTPIRIGV